MATLTETDTWVDGIYQLEEEDLVKGGADGIDNVQAKQLANRTTYLKALVESLGANKQDAAVTLAALATLIGSANQLPYFTGANSAALTGFTAFARTLVASADAATARTALGAVTQVDITNAIVAKAPLASPALTGTPTAPTAAGGTNTTQLANTAFVQTALAALVNASPAALDTLNELAAALGNDPNFATTVTNAIAAKAPLASPALTGTPSAPTAVAGTNTTQLATTAFVLAALSGVPTQLPGEVAFFARSTAPTGFLKANGAAVSRTTYATLFAAIGATFGVGDGSTTFNLPDLRGEFLRGWDDSRGVDVSRVFGSAQADAMQGHRHSPLSGTGFVEYGSGGGGSPGSTNGPADATTGNPVTDTVNGTPRTGSETRPRNVALLACIKF